MQIDSIKTILLVITSLLILYSLLFKQKLPAKKIKFLVSSLVINLILLLIIVIKLHHFLRLEFGIPNTLLYFFVAILFILYFYNFRLEILKTNFILLLFSISFISLAVIHDLLTDGRIISYTVSDLIEELLRITGIGFWSLYYFLYILKLRNT
jgi:hypothetical protein